MRRFFKITALFLWASSAGISMILAFTPNLVKMLHGSDKMLHILMCCLLILGPTLFFSQKKYIFFIALFLMAMGIGIEIFQSTTPDRHAEIEDIASNIFGVSLGVLIGYLLKSGFYAALPSNSDPS